MKQYQIVDSDLKRLAMWGHVSFNDDQLKRFKFIEDETKHLAKLILMHCPVSRERSTALSRLEEVKMWAVSSLKTET